LAASPTRQFCKSCSPERLGTIQAVVRRQQ
jgi:hypothetical protein